MASHNMGSSTMIKRNGRTNYDRLWHHQHNQVLTKAYELLPATMSQLFPPYHHI
jgi:hypothetical protein